MNDASGIVDRELPGYKIKKQILFNDLFVFILSSPDPDEPDIFFKVNKLNGEYTDFSPWNEPDPVALEEALLT